MPHFVVAHDMIERRIRIITLFFLFVPLYWLIGKIGKIRNEKKGTSQKFILLLNWQENEEKQKIVIQNQYKGDSGYSEEPFKSEQI